MAPKVCRCKKFTSSDGSISIRKTGGCICDFTVVGGSKLARMPVTFERLADEGDTNQNIDCLSVDDLAPFKPDSITIHVGRTTNPTQVGSFGQAILADGNSVTEQGMMYAFADTVARSYIGLVAYVFVAGGGQWVGTLVNSGLATRLRISWVGHPVFGGLNITGSIIIHGVKV